MTPEAWSAKEITQLLLQCGALGLLFLVLMMGIYLVVQMGNRFLEKIDTLHHSIIDLAKLIVDHKARAGDTPPHIQAQASRRV